MHIPVPAQWFVPALFALACRSPVPAAVAVDPAVKEDYEAQARRHERLAKRLSEVDAKRREACEFQVGDCLLIVADQYRDLMDVDRPPACVGLPRGEATSACVERELVAAGEIEGFRVHHAASARCLEGVMTCVEELARKEAESERQRLIEERSERIDALPLLADQRRERVLMAGRVEYVRGTLPAAAEGACTELPERAACEARVKELEAEVTEVLGRDAADYSEEAAIAAVTRLNESALECPGHELRCLDRTLAGYGATRQTDAARERVFALLAERERLRRELAARTAQSCVDVALADHMPRVVESYRRYSRQHGEYFTLQLHYAFAALYRAENACLQRLGKARHR